MNRHWFKKGDLPPRSVYIGRGTTLGNPFTVAEHGEAALSKYRVWIWEKIQSKDAAVLRTMRNLKPDTVLICSCKPRPCHGDVVRLAWIWMRDQGLLEEQESKGGSDA